MTVIEYEELVWYFSHQGPIEYAIHEKFFCLPIKLRKEITSYPKVK